ncbi:hypothetical protein RHGRI_023883 [Rhododendron griersonianum]|uniref:histone deacetylase n=1 Tax=Rhododendron griersonianum TaxID=479676 RepID=A0AAV6J5A2_9ERIC|nr:hypothetical protein RHGRI_023883 [Rhododendron griersonianum]
MVGNMKPDVKSKKARRQKKMTLEDMYNNQYDFDDEDDDSDWEPVQKPAAVVKWFCVNCTMVNLGDDSHCDICGEHKESGILKHGYFASPFLKEAGLSQNELEVKERYKDPCSQISESGKFTAVGFDERMLLHSEVEMKSHPHPERPDRLRAITASLATAGIFPGRCFPISAREITEEELHMVHSLEHIQSVELTSQLLASYFTPDTYANEHSARAARLAAGLCADLASEILSGHAKNGFALVRPPGHHAGIRQAMGFCLHNNAAVAALAAQGVGAKRVLIVDWDVHHGNGTQEIFDGSKTVICSLSCISPYIGMRGGSSIPALAQLMRKYCFIGEDEERRHYNGLTHCLVCVLGTSLLNSTCQPGSRNMEKDTLRNHAHVAENLVGSMGAEGYCVNVPWSRGGVGDNDYLFAFQHVVLPIASAFSPDFIIISAGFDAARGDPLGCCDVTPSGFAQMTHALNALSGGKLLVILEGGYNLRSISSSATAVIKVLLGESPGCEAENVVPSKSGLLTVMEVLKIQMKFWPTLEPILLKLNLQWGTYALPNRIVCLRSQRTGPMHGTYSRLDHDTVLAMPSSLHLLNVPYCQEKQKKKRQRAGVPVWWQWGRKRWLYHLLSGDLHVRLKGV